jgi:outer membrane protein assembly factor BamB
MATSFQTPTTDQLTWREQQDARERNDFSYRSTVDHQELPQSGHVAFEATATAVLVTATDMDVLGEWLYVMGGKVTTVDLPSGQTAWTLRTTTWSDSPKFPPVPVFVTVVQSSDASVMREIVAAVTR